jgi:hypothetical protein
MSRSLICALALSSLVSVAGAETLNFDDIGVQGTYISEPNLYRGFNFSYTMDVIDLVDSSWNFGARSGDFAILNNYGGAGLVTQAGGGTFSFDGLWAKAWDTAPNSGGPTVLSGSLQGLLNGNVVWSVATALNGSYRHFAAQAGQIDTLRMDFGNYFLVDDLSLNGVSAVPEASSVAMLALGLGVLGGLARRRRA